MDKIAIISDIHGNLEALKTVLEDISERGIQHVFCLGDTIGKGLHSYECMQLVKKHCEVVIRGNWEEAYDEVKPQLYVSHQFKENHLEEKAFAEMEQEIQEFLFSYEFYLSGNYVRIFHSTPTNTTDSIFQLNSVWIKYPMFLPSEKTQTKNRADIVVYGHTHICYSEYLYHRLLINAGSVGNGINLIENKEKNADSNLTTMAHYLILE
ncbi:MAG: metallophosphoesterase family protein [Firmicutes bacterium]|nr:metallophosphoesterase family protein [Bacillota bacterium]